MTTNLIFMSSISYFPSPPTYSNFSFAFSQSFPSLPSPLPSPSPPHPLLSLASILSTLSPQPFSPSLLPSPLSPLPSPLIPLLPFPLHSPTLCILPSLKRILFLRLLCRSLPGHNALHLSHTIISCARSTCPMKK
ncbi:hypothetical protein P691DRAFT_391255 [Macrolepiota fuliginosa MF-IS2]|uniref:Uncharacterized protein n=1 Tax=Macrolepiota fuliginosa MF-IS2 TaxID=1400762 RepID=A0A9P5X419_9AGAR|nr:hypothetical protein P691DRAFT_391255 [Macrolepiota fuliginosa MF-IS2]